MLSGRFRCSQPEALLTAAAWLALTAVSTLPLMLGAPHLDFTDALFETMSAMTTTGATVIGGLASGELCRRDVGSGLDAASILEFGVGDDAHDCCGGRQAQFAGEAAGAVQPVGLADQSSRTTSTSQATAAARDA